MAVPSFAGVFCFGSAVHVVHEPVAAVEDRRAYFGFDGTAALYGGGRGRRFEVRGVFTGATPAACVAAEAELLALAGPPGGDLVDTQGRVWPAVVFSGVYHPDPGGPKQTDYGWCLPYRCELEGLL